MPEEPRVEAAEQEAGAPEAAQPPAEPVDPPADPIEDWLEAELPPDEETGVDWRRVAVIAAFVALSVAIAVFFVWTYLLPSASTGM